MFNKQDIKKLKSECLQNQLDIMGLKADIKQIQSFHRAYSDETKEAFKRVKEDYDQLSKWDDHRREEIRKIATAAGLEIHRGTHLVPVEDEE